MGPRPRVRSVRRRHRTGGFIAIADTWGTITDDCQPFTFGAFGNLQRSTACDPLLGSLATLEDDFHRIRADLVAGPLSKERIDEQLAAWTAQIESSVAEAAELHDDAPSAATWTTSLDAFVQGLALSRNSDGKSTAMSRKP